MDPRHSNGNSNNDGHKPRGMTPREIGLALTQGIGPDGQPLKCEGALFPVDPCSGEKFSVPEFRGLFSRHPFTVYTVCEHHAYGMTRASVVVGCA